MIVLPDDLHLDRNNLASSEHLLDEAEGHREIFGLLNLALVLALPIGIFVNDDRGFLAVDAQPVIRGLHAGLDDRRRGRVADGRSEEQTSELQSLMRNSYAVFCFKKK